MNCLFHSRTTHARLVPFARRFSQRLLHVFLDLDAMPETALFKRNRFALFSFHDRDHGDATGALRAWAARVFRDAGVSLANGRIGILCFPRVLGYAFNPIALFIGYGTDGAPRGVIYQVNNTFGERHFYVAALSGDGAPEHHGAEKRFHVSPFFDVGGRYAFRLRAPDARFALTVESFADGARTHVASMSGVRAPLSDRALLAAFVRLPFSTLRVIAGIHWHALLLWLRGARYRAKPAPPANPVTRAYPLRAPQPVS